MLKFVVILLGIFSMSYGKNNNLITEISPYLNRHAHHPVNWYAWNDETLKLARKEQKPIFLSIGYSTCNWCHIMEEESFEHEDVAKVLNKYFISIKVDREEFPHIDKKYQNIFKQNKSRRAGWPLSVFMTPNLKVYDMKGYIPRNSYSPETENILILTKRLGELYHNKEALRSQLKIFSEKSTNINNASKLLKHDLTLKEIMHKAVTKIGQQYDMENAGFSKGATKFPEASKLELLLNIYKISGDKEALYMAKNTLLSMSKRGLYDQIEGGFFRYTGKNWRLPHFQKLLYVNAQLPPLYLEMYKLTEEKYFYEIAEKTINLMIEKYMKGGHYISASDSIGEKGIEGEYFMYEYNEVFDALEKEGFTEEEIDDALEYFNIEMGGNTNYGLSHVNIMSKEITENVLQVKRYLEKMRKEKNYPFFDDKIITSWNAMMIKTLFIMSQYDRRYMSIAKRQLGLLVSLMYKNGTLYHQAVGSTPPIHIAQLEDYAYLIDTILMAYQVTLDKKHLILATQLAYQAKTLFLSKGVWYMNVGTPKVQADFDDRYYTSALSVLLKSFLILANLYDTMDLAEESNRMMNVYARTNTDKLLDNSSFITLLLRKKQGTVTLKASFMQLEKYRNEFMEIDYPFLLKKVHKYNEYMACKLGLCLSTAKYFKDIKVEIEKMKNTRKVKATNSGWVRK